TSCGRLFDAVAALAGGRATIQYEAQAAIEFMQAVPELPVRGYRPEWREEGRRLILDVPDLIRQVVQDIRTGRTLPVISGRFHRYLVDAFLLAVRILSRDTGLRTVGLSGGVFQNQVLLEALVGALQAAGYEVLTHRQVPCNDGGISLGQVWAGRGLVKQ
ncbi:MAG: carbamoyltransferase HypF, partial [Candidatus Neomarinimicrobiota bacterium]